MNKNNTLVAEKRSKVMCVPWFFLLQTGNRLLFNDRLKHLLAKVLK